MQHAPTRTPSREIGSAYDKRASSAFIYNYFRDYDPQVGRYIESDPIGLKGGLNTYAYVENQPTRMTDSRGLQATIGLPIYGPPLIRLCTNPLGCIGAGLGLAYMALSECKPNDREKCEIECNNEYDRGRDLCRVSSGMRGRDKSVFQYCMAQVDERYIECFQDCGKKYGK